jgi:predicted ATPase
VRNAFWCAEGWGLIQQGRVDEGIEQLHQGLDAQRTTEVENHRPHILALLAEAYGIAGQVEAGLLVLEEALTLVNNSTARVYGAELQRLHGVLLLRHATPDTAMAEACFHQALSVARQQQARSWELRAATNLARL